MLPRETLMAFDRYLAERSLRLDGVLIGGAALNLLGVVSRPTKDCDILHPHLPRTVLEAARMFAADVRGRGEALDDDWLNNGPASLATQLPARWEERLQRVFSGAAIQLDCLGRMDLLRAKLFALCDRGLDLADCVALTPTRAEISGILPWLEQQDGNPGWPTHVRETVADLARRLGYGV